MKLFEHERRRLAPFLADGLGSSLFRITAMGLDRSFERAIAEIHEMQGEQEMSKVTNALKSRGTTAKEQWKGAHVRRIINDARYTVTYWPTSYLGPPNINLKPRP